MRFLAIPFAAAAGLLVLLILTACATQPAGDFRCPEAGFAKDSNYLTVFPPQNAKKTPENAALEIRMGAVSGFCTYNDRKQEMNIDVEVSFAGKTARNGDYLKEKSYDFLYFVAVLAPDESVLRRESFSVTLNFDNNGIAQAQDMLTLQLPAPREVAGRYKIVAGIELGENDLKYNRGERQP